MLWQINFMNRRATFSVILLLGLSSCGWQLRGYDPEKPFVESNLDSVNVSSTSRDNAFFRRFYATLKRNHIQEDNASEFSLEIFEEEIDRKPLAYNRIGTPSQYKLTLSISYRFSRSGEELLPLTQVISRRNYDFDPNLIIAKDKEQEALIKEMRDELSQKIIDSVNNRL